MSESIISNIIEELTSVAGGSKELLKLKAELDKQLISAIETMKKAEDEAAKLAEEEAKRAAKEEKRNQLLQMQMELNEQLDAMQETMENIAMEINSFRETISSMKTLSIPTDAAEAKLKEREVAYAKMEAKINELYNDLNKVEDELKDHHRDASPSASTVHVIHLTAEEKELFSTTIKDIHMTIGDYKYLNSNGNEVYGLPLYRVKVGDVEFKVQLRSDREDFAPGMEVIINAEHIQTTDGLRYFAWAEVETISEYETRLQKEAEDAAAKKEIAAAKKARLEAAEKAKEEVIAKAMKEAEEGNFATMANFFNKKFGAAR